MCAECTLSVSCSLRGNSIGTEGAMAMSSAMKVMTDMREM